MDVALNKATNAYRQASSIIGKGGIAGGDSIGDGSAPQGANFSELVSEGLEEARGAGYNSEIVSTKALANKAELTDLVSSITNAELTLNTVVGVRDKIINAYQEILRMPI
jgi:flagellar hook-basal body complex protein FliE